MGKNRELFWELLEPEYNGAMMFCRKLLGDSERGDDLFQDALVVAYSSLDSLREHSSFRPWLYRILVNTFRSQTRRPWWKRFVPLSTEVELSLTGEDPVEVHSARRWLQRAFEVLSPDDQALVTLHELEGWPVDDLARTFGKTEGAIKARLFRSRRKMKDALLRFSKKPGGSNNESLTEKRNKQCVVVKPD